MTPEAVKVDHGKYDEIERKAWEKYLLALAIGWAAEEERLDPSLLPLIKQVRLVYPGTSKASLEFRTYYPRSQKEVVDSYSLYDDPFVDENGSRVRNHRQALGDVLMWVRGG